ncbi:hypothetical protein ACEPPN_009326 [Leptodophora sp. 'Broadleaf-Isolate-01']
MTTPSYMLPENFDFPPGGAIAMGKVLKDPKKPNRALYSAAVDVALVTETKKSPWSFSSKDARSGSVGLFASFLAPILGLGADVAGNLSQDHEHIYKCEELTTRYFDPDDTFIARCLCAPTVKVYTKSHRWRSIYIITGIKIAHGAMMETIVEAGKGAEGNLTADGTPSGVPIGGGPKASYDHTKTRTVKFGSGEDFVLAYRLLRIKPKGEDSFKEEDFNKFALLGDDEGDMEEEERKEAAQHLHEAWDIGEIMQPVGEDDLKDVELSVLDGSDFNFLNAKLSSA